MASTLGAMASNLVAMIWSNCGFCTWQHLATTFPTPSCPAVLLNHRVSFGPWEIYLAMFYMKKFGHSTWKRTVVMSNHRCIASLNRGPLKKHEKKCKVKTTKTYRDSHGRQRYQGSKELKGTELLVFNNGFSWGCISRSFTSNSKTVVFF